VAKDVAEALGIVWNGRRTLETVPDDWILVGKLPTTFLQRDGSSRAMEIEMIAISEGKENASIDLRVCNVGRDHDSKRAGSAENPL
jgi:hypothetical protein